VKRAANKLGLRRAWLEMAHAGRHRLGLLLGAGLLIFVPLGLVDVLDESLQEPFRDADDADAITIVALGGAAFAHSAIALGGDVLYAGVVTAAVVAVREGREHSLREIASTLPYGRLIVADIALALVVAAGLILLIVPGLILLARFTLVAPAVEDEGRGVRDAFRRSNALVRGNTGRVLALVLPAIILGEVLAGALQSGAVFDIGDSFLGDWAGAALADLIASPLYALAVVVAFLELRGAGTTRAAHRPPAGKPGPTVGTPSG
jgi:hypothetical protein